MSAERPKTRAAVEPRRWDSMVRNCRAYFERHDDYYCRSAYVQNLARLHNVSMTELWADVVGTTAFSSWQRAWLR